MNHPRLTILRVLGRKLSIVLLLAVTAAGAFATLGDGRKKNPGAPAPLLSGRTSTPGSFNLKSGYTFRGSQVLKSEKKYINLNTVVTLQRGNTTYVLPLKKKVLVSNVKISLGNRQFRRN
jgi:hypothetical protein